MVQSDQRGFQVAELSGSDLDELTKARCWLDGQALRESIEKGGADWEERVLLAYHRLSRIPRYLEGQSATRNAEWEHAHKEFHASLLSACGTKWIEGFCDQMFDAAERYRHAARIASSTNRGDLDEHRAIMEAAVARQADTAVALLQQHFQTTSDLVRKVFNSSERAD
ncbi:FCD domain-containing protein [Tardiphaga alba]|uniref:FCD domain-containing protein n=1 Tax=Tardiphaga alba TaxID=340268 RepID=UPI0020123036|nr:FCD domain-containing protein [Tardiphaga alba]